MQLQEQLKEKHNKLQAAILKQQVELQQITQQLAFASQSNVVPILPVPSVGKSTLQAVKSVYVLYNRQLFVDGFNLTYLH